MTTVHKFVSALLAAGFAIGLTGCGTPGAPLPPSLNLPNRVADLSATRTGNQVSLAWTMPRKNTDKLMLKNKLAVRVCRREGSAECLDAGGDLLLAPGGAGVFTEMLPAALASGAPRTLTYSVEVKNRNGRSAGFSNPAAVLAGQAPAPLTSLTAELRKDGVVLRWDSTGGTAGELAHTAIRLHRKLLSAESNAKSKTQPGLLSLPAEPAERTLLVEPTSPVESPRASSSNGTRTPDRALDKQVIFGQTYEYRAQRVAQVTVSGHTLELVGEPSAPVRIEVREIFPPAVPTGLAAVATGAEPGADTVAGYSIDLSWQPVTDTDLAGYFVYRRETEGDWQRISPAQPLAGPAFHDAQVLPGHTYNYQVSAINHAGHESARSVETEETIPAL